MIRRSPHQTIMMLFGVLLISLTFTAPPAEAGLLDTVQAANAYADHPGHAAPGNDRIEQSGRRLQGGVPQAGPALVKEGPVGNVDSKTDNRRAEEFVDKQAQRAVRAFLKAAAENLKLKVSNPLEGVQDKLGDTLLGKATTAVKKKIQATTPAGAGPGAANLDVQYGPIDPRIALDINEEETEWYQAETSLMDTTPLPRVEVVAYADDNRDQSPAGDWDALFKGDRQNDHVQRNCENDWAGCPVNSWDRERQATVRERNPWSDIDDDAHETESHPASECRNPWGVVDANCADGYQGDEGRSDATDVASISDETQGGTYHKAVDRLLGNETESDSDPYVASGEGYEEAVAQLEAEAAERARQAQLEAETAERARQAQLEAETAERARRANSYETTGRLLGSIGYLLMLIPFP
ncbi:MAG: hypothetical protein OXC69_10325 [Candidatus Tectomicrobia bacterium]|nr:hypothetical protein [Candidatus Tectomicrobia bacterium]